MVSYAFACKPGGVGSSIIANKLSLASRPPCIAHLSPANPAGAGLSTTLKHSALTFALVEKGGPSVLVDRRGGQAELAADLSVDFFHLFYFILEL